MKIELQSIPIRELVKGYADKGEEGVVGYGGALDIRPPYQREFVYKDKQRDAVIDTVVNKFPLNAMYWVVNEKGYEVMDGQQRILSICQYVEGVFSRDFKFWHNLKEDEKDRILDYELMVYFCKGESSEKLDWFRTINIAGEKLKDQELRNAVYAGSWTMDAKGWFSRNNCAAEAIGSKFLNGSAIRQDLLETAIDWISGGEIEDYMSRHQHDKNAKELWNHFERVIDWVKTVFATYRKEMKGLPWGPLYEKFKDEQLDATKLEDEIKRLLADKEVGRKKGIWEYVLTREEKHLSLRAFEDDDKRTVYERQDGICAICKDSFEIEECEADHILPWSKGGKTEIENCQVLCKLCNQKKSNK